MRQSVPHLQRAEGLAEALARGAASAASSPRRPAAPRMVVVDFVTAVKRLEWDARHKALEDFTAVLPTGPIADFVLSSKSTIDRLFDILLGGLLDVHFRIVAAVLAYGRTLLAIVPTRAYAAHAKFAGLATARLLAVATSVQFRAKHQLVSDALQLIDAIEGWLGDRAAFADMLIAAALRKDTPAYAKVRHLAMERLVEHVARALSGQAAAAVENAALVHGMICHAPLCPPAAA